MCVCVCGECMRKEGDKQTYIHKHIHISIPSYSLSQTRTSSHTQTHTHIHTHTQTEEEFVTIMANLGLPYPKRIDEVVPKNLVCGC